LGSLFSDATTVRRSLYFLLTEYKSYSVADNFAPPSTWPSLHAVGKSVGRGRRPVARFKALSERHNSRGTREHMLNVYMVFGPVRNPVFGGVYRFPFLFN